LEVIRLWSLDIDLGKFLQDSSTLQDGAFFHSLVHIIGKNVQIFTKNLPEMYLWTKKFR